MCVKTNFNVSNVKMTHLDNCAIMHYRLNGQPRTVARLSDKLRNKVREEIRGLAR